MKRILLYILAATAIVNFSCSSQLDELPKGVKVTENAITTAKSAEIALNGAYFRFADGGDDYYGNPSNRFYSLNEITAGMLGGLVNYKYGGDPTYDNNIQYTSHTAESQWSYCYRIISAANAVLEGVVKLDDKLFDGNRKQEILSEAYFLRAYGHHKLLLHFGQYWDVNSKYGVLIRDKFVISTEIVKERSTVAESYNFILEDLKMAIANMPETNEKFYGTVWAAKLLKARVLINRGEGSDYTDVIGICDDVISNGGFTLEENVKDVFTNGLASSEVILGIRPESEAYYKEDTYFGRKYYTPQPYMIGLFENDPRGEWIFNADSSSVAKYQGPNTEVCYVFRLTEAYLLKAEAIARSNGNLDDAKNVLKIVLAKAGVTDMAYIDNVTMKDEFLKEVYKEFAKNMSFENMHEWFALLRLPIEDVQAVKPGVESKNQYIFPIPKLEIDRNSAIDQNPGYKSSNTEE